MLSVIIATNNHETELAHTLSALVVGAVEGLVSDVIILDSGSTDGTEIVAEAAGCLFIRSWGLADVFQQMRGDWILMIEPGARPLLGWIDAISEHMAIATKPASFSRSRRHSRSLMQMLFHRTYPLELGLLLPKSLAISKVTSAVLSPYELAKRQNTQRLCCEIVPARSMTQP